MLYDLGSWPSVHIFVATAWGCDIRFRVAVVRPQQLPSAHSRPEPKGILDLSGLRLKYEKHRIAACRGQESP